MLFLFHAHGEGGGGGELVSVSPRVKEIIFTSGLGHWLWSLMLLFEFQLCH